MGGLTRNTGLVPVFAWRAAARFLEAALQAASSSEAKVCLQCLRAIYGRGVFYCSGLASVP